MIKCLNCNNEAAIKDPKYGYLPGKKCQRQFRATIKPQIPTELAGDEIKEGRRMFKKDVIQPYRNGVLSKEYINAYGSKGLTVTHEDIKEAQYVWNNTETQYYEEHD